MKDNPLLFRKLYDDYHVMVYNCALNYLQHTADAEEITQDVFVKVYQSMQQFNEKSSLKTWIYRITINKCLDFIDKKNTRKRWFVFSNKAADDYEMSRIPDFEHPGILLENKEKAQILFEAINSLNENQRTAFMLSKLDGLGNSEIAEVMQTTISAVESMLFRAKASLREKLSEKFENYRKNKS
ncbi:RNA polymerase sigma factor [Flavobacterium sp. 3HN19-14]|uniref:RNA polymerase sigma factor n=1 Tax=Flavobacterium sp. 3HN19-14 TaxID=3448133 RepID=UPI003EE1F3EA